MRNGTENSLCAAVNSIRQGNCKFKKNKKWKTTHIWLVFLLQKLHIFSSLKIQKLNFDMGNPHNSGSASVPSSLVPLGTGNWAECTMSSHPVEWIIQSALSQVGQELCFALGHSRCIEPPNRGSAAIHYVIHYVSVQNNKKGQKYSKFVEERKDF